MDPLYDIFFAGQLVDGIDEGTARSNMGKLFKANEATLDKLFSGNPYAIKRGVDNAGAAKYKAAMHKAGAVALIKTQQAEEPAPSAPVPEPAPDPFPSSADIIAEPEKQGGSMADRIAAMAAEPRASANPRAATFGEAESAIPPAADEAPAADGELSLAPAGSDVLRENEREVIEDLNIDTSAINLSSSSEEPEALGGNTEAPIDPDTSHLSMGEVGEVIPHLESELEELDPDVSHLSMGEVGEVIPHLEKAVEEVNPDISAISLAPEGSDVLEEEFRRHDDAEAPSTEHITLEES
jgi:hypothetical protein